MLPNKSLSSKPQVLRLGAINDPKHKLSLQAGFKIRLQGLRKPQLEIRIHSKSKMLVSKVGVRVNKMQLHQALLRNTWKNSIVQISKKYTKFLT